MKTVKNKIKKGMTLLLAVTLLLAMGLTAHGADPGGAGSTTTGFNDQAKTGELTLTIPDTKTSSQFSVYKVLTATADKGQEVYEYTYTDSFKSLGEGQSPTLPIGQITGAKDGPKEYKIDTYTVDKEAAVLENHVKTNKIEATATISESEKTASDLPLGYYLILETKITEGQKQTKPMLVAIPSVTKNAETGIYEYNYDVKVTLKDQPLITKKKIVVDQGKEVDTIAKQVSEEVTFEIVQDVPKYDDTHKTITFNVVDKMSKGLTFDEVTSVKAGTTELTSDGATKKYEFKKTPNSDGTTTLTFDFSDHTKNPSKPGDDYYDSVKNAEKVTITYTARLNKDASFGETGNSNEVYAEFGDGSVNGGELTRGASAYTINYAGEVEIKKVGETPASGEAPPLKDVVFTIYKESGEADSGFDAQEDKAVKVVTYQRGDQDNQITTNPNEGLSSTDTTGADGIARFAGLGAGTYYIKETSAPNPYILLEEPIKVVVKMNKPSSVNEGKGKATFSYDVSGDGVKDNTTTNTNGKVSFTVENKKGFVLPTTGGMGTYLFTIGGALLILAAVVLILRSRKKTN